MFPFGIFPFNVMPTANPWWPVQVAQTQGEMQKMQDAMPPYMKAYFDAYSAWMAMMTKSNPWMASFNQKVEK
ncbi:MAG: hypothetical protein H6R18_979 [Proteobacteria bacterium]|nr:hypothetical protein [Pseudomonadota bacterium]